MYASSIGADVRGEPRLEIIIVEHQRSSLRGGVGLGLAWPGGGGGFCLGRLRAPRRRFRFPPVPPSFAPRGGPPAAQGGLFGSPLPPPPDRVRNARFGFVCG